MCSCDKLLIVNDSEHVHMTSDVTPDLNPFYNANSHQYELTVSAIGTISLSHFMQVAYVDIFCFSFFFCFNIFLKPKFAVTLNVLANISFI